jgi:hypothetical protein
MLNPSGGEGGIRTHGPVSRTPDFESGTLSRSATSPSISMVHKFAYLAILSKPNLRFEQRKNYETTPAGLAFMKKLVNPWYSNKIRRLKLQIQFSDRLKSTVLVRIDRWREVREVQK